MPRINLTGAHGRQRLVQVGLLVAVVALSLLGVGAVSANAASSIEGVWSFNGGEIAIQPAAEGTYQGTVVTETKFAECTHPVNQVIWTDMRLQPDGSYWGFHQWYFESAGCALNTTLGPTAWRVMEGNGTRSLLVCLSSPGTSQPTIAANGAESGDTYGCVSSAPATVGVATFKLASLPSSKKCLSFRHFKIHLRDPQNDAFKNVVITLRGKRLATTREGAYTVATVNLRGLPRGAFTVKIRATTVLGQHISGSRTYHTCVPKAKRSSRRKKKGKTG
jgi:hypothetical protein